MFAYFSQRQYWVDLFIVILPAKLEDLFFSLQIQNVQNKRREGSHLPRSIVQFDKWHHSRRKLKKNVEISGSQDEKKKMY